MRLTPGELLDLLEGRGAVLTASADAVLTPAGPEVVLARPDVSDITITLPDARAVARRIYTVKLYRRAAGVARIATFAVQTIDDGAVAVPVVLENDLIVLRVLSDGTGWLLLQPGAASV